MTVLLVLSAFLAACHSDPAPVDSSLAGPDYTRPLPDGASALRPVPFSDVPLADAWQSRDAHLLDALERSMSWFEKPSSRTHFPLGGVTHQQARESVARMHEIVRSSETEAEFLAEVESSFDAYQSVGWDDEGTVLFTGYYAPIFPASDVRTSRFTAPLYRRPADLVTDEATGEPLGRRAADGSVGPYPTRAEIEATDMFAGTELVWLEDRLSAFLVHVNGSAKLRMPDGSVRYVGYDGKTDQPYGSLGQALLRDGLLDANSMSIPGIRRAYERNPDAVAERMNENRSFVFFTDYEEGRWPAGSLGLPVAAERSLATDKRIYPRGGIVVVDTEAVRFSSGTRRFTRMMLDQDTGGAIRAPGRADIFMGIGPAAGILAGEQHAEGELYYLFLKPERVAGAE